MSPEFPSDNPELWLARMPTRAPFAAALESELEAEVEVVEFEDADFAVVESMPSATPAPPTIAEDPFQRFVRTLVNVALGAGAATRVASLLPAMIGAERLDVQALDASAVDMLVAGNLLARTESGAITRAPSFVANAQAWRATMLGEKTELSVSSMLDEWSAHIVATLAAVPDRKEALRRELRAHGIAAFGLVEAA